MQAGRVRVFKKLSTPGSNFVHSKICYNSRHFISTNRYEVRILNDLYSVRPHNLFYLNTREGFLRCEFRRFSILPFYTRGCKTTSCMA